MFKNRLELVKYDVNNAYYLNIYVQVLVVCISCLVLTFLKTICMSVYFIIFCFFFKVNSGVFLHNRVATLVEAHWQHWQHWWKYIQYNILYCTVNFLAHWQHW